MNIEAARQQMIEQQVRAWEVLDERVLEVLREVRREFFVPPAYRELAFADTAIPLPHGQQMLAPKIEGRILQALDVQPGDETLEVGTGSGFFAACLARLAGQVHSLEIFPELAALAGENLRAAGVSGVIVETKDAMSLSEQGRYDVIAVTGSVPLYDERFQQALKIGGRLFVIVGEEPIMEALLVRRMAADHWVRESLFETVVPALVNAPQPPRFVF